MIRILLHVALFAFCTLCLVAPSSAQEVSPNPAPAETLSLKQAIRMAVEKNLDVKAELYNPAQYEAEVNRNLGIYDPQFTGKLSYESLTGPSASSVWAGADEGQSTSVGTSISQLFWTGATTSLDFNNRYDHNNSPITSREYWQSSLGVTLNQPLLKKFGRENTDISIDISRLSRLVSVEHFYSRLLDTVAQVRSEYYKLYNLRELLEVKRASLGLARSILQETTARVAADLLSAMEILNAEFGVVTREKEVIDAEKAVSDQVDVLRLLLQLEGEGDLVTTDLPWNAPVQVDEREALKLVLTRPDILEQKRNLKIAELQTRIYTNRLKPDLSFTATASLVGLGGTFPRDMEKLGKADQAAWNVGLTFVYPFGNNVAENDYRKSKLKTDQTVVQIKSLEEGAVTAAKSAVRGIRNSYKQIGVSERGRAYAEERLKAYIRMNEVGLVTVKDVLEVENDLATAKGNQATALVTYNNALTLLWQTTGELLEREGIRQSDEVGHDLYLGVAVP
jgi:outer membrane protein TolC